MVWEGQDFAGEAPVHPEVDQHGPSGVNFAFKVCIRYVYNCTANPHPFKKFSPFQQPIEWRLQLFFPLV
jgi:hypothetical protein